MVDGLTVFKLEATVHDEETDQLVELTIGPTNDRESLNRLKASFENGLTETQDLIEHRRDTLTRGVTERSDRYYNDEHEQQTE